MFVYERILKIGQHLAKLEAEYSGIFFRTRCTASDKRCDTRYTLGLPKYADLACDEESDSDRRVDVSAADVRNHPDDRRHAEAERQRNLDDVAQCQWT